MLALCMVRLMDPMDEAKQIERIAKIYLERGATLNDPYLKSIGQWWQKDYVKAVNELSPVEVRSVEHLFKDVKEHNLDYDAWVK